MAWIQIVNIPSWTVQDVQEWMKGLDDDLQCYRGAFEDNQIVGTRLLSLHAEDLEDLQINKIGHQELLLEAIGLLHDLNFSLPTDTLQSVTLSLSCGAKHLHSVVTKRQREREISSDDQNFPTDGLTSDVLMFVTHVITSAKLLISWLDRPPFSTSGEYNAVRQKVLEHVMKLNSFSQLTGDAAIVERAILTTSKELLVLGEDFIRNACDPLIIQPAYIELVTLRKPSSDIELGLYIKTSILDGIHYIADTKRGSPAHQNEKIQPGDEVLQINKQTVVGWHHKKLIGALKADKSGVVLTLKKRPCNLKTPGHVINSHRWAGKAHTSSASTMPLNKVKHYSRRKLVEQGIDATEDQTAERPLQQKSGQPRKCIEKEGNPPGIQDTAKNSEVKTKEVSQTIKDTDGVNQQIETNLETKDEERAINSTSPEMSTKSDSIQQDVEREEMEVSIEKEAQPTDDALDSDNPREFPGVPPNESTEDNQSSQSCTDTTENDEEVIDSDQQQVEVLEPRQIDQEDDDVEPLDLSDTTSQEADSLDRERLSTMKSETQSIASTSSTESQVRLRPKKRSRRHKDRHVSCVDLGPGQYEGWLEKKTDTRFGTKWSRVWCVLKDFVFYYYKSKKDLKAKGIICLIGYEVTDEECKKQNQFRISHKGLKPFIFAVERKTDLNAWLEKLRLVSVMFNKPDVGQEGEKGELAEMARDMAGYHSESDDEENPSIRITSSGGEQEVDVGLDAKGQRSSSSSTGDELLLTANSVVNSSSMKKASSMSTLATEGSVNIQNGSVPNNVSGTLIKSNSFSSLTVHATQVIPKIKSRNIGNGAASPGVMRRLKNALKSRSNTDIKRSYTTASEFSKQKKHSAPAVFPMVDSSNAKQEQKPETADEMLKLLNEVRESGAEVPVFDGSKRSSFRRGPSLNRKPTVLHRDPGRNKLLLQKRAFQRTRKAKLTELELVMKLLSGPLTSESLQEWKCIHGSILGQDEHNSSSEGEQDVQPDGDQKMENQINCHHRNENEESSRLSDDECCESNKEKLEAATACEQSKNSHEQDGLIDSHEKTLEQATGKHLENQEEENDYEQQKHENELTGEMRVSSNETKSRLETDLDSVDVLSNNNCDESIDDPDDETDNSVQYTGTGNHELTDNIQENGIIHVQGNETHL